MQNDVRNNMIIIGLTGNIAVGKSTVSSMLRKLGAVIIDADQTARAVVAKGMPALREIVEYFGDEYIMPDGELNRPKLAETIFSSPEMRCRLNSIIHPYIKKDILSQIERYKKENGDKIIVIDAALLIEVGWTDIVDEIWLVTLPKELQIERLMNRNNLNKEQAERRILSQMDQGEKEKYATWVIDNSRSLNETWIQVKMLWDKIYSRR